MKEILMLSTRVSAMKKYLVLICKSNHVKEIVDRHLCYCMDSH